MEVSVSQSEKRQQLSAAIPVLAAIAAGILIRKAVERSWELRYDRPAPKDPTLPDIGWNDALFWGASVGLLTGISRVTARRLAHKAVH